MPSPPHPRLRNRHSLPRALSNSADPSDSAARELWTAIPCDSLEYRRVVPTVAVGTTIADRPPQSGGTVARSGLRMMPTFPPSPLSFRPAGFPQYGWKAGISDRAFPLHPPLKPAPGIRRRILGLPLPFVRRVV